MGGAIPLSWEKDGTSLSIRGDQPILSDSMNLQLEKAGLPIVTGITKYELPNRKGHILI